MKFSIQNYRAVKSAEFEVNGITLVAGKNAMGKSYLAEACGLVLTGETMPKDLPKKDLQKLIYRGAKTALVASSSNEKGNALIEYPGCGYSTRNGVGISASRIAAGLESPCDYKPKEFAGLLSALLKTEPTQQDLMKAVEKAYDYGFTGEDFDKLWNMITDDGWDTAHWDIVHAKAKNSCAELKGEWKHATGGEIYGSKKAETWTPAGWDPGLENNDADDLKMRKMRIEELDSEYVKSIRRGAVDDAEIERLQKLARDVDTAQTIYDEKQKKAEELLHKLREYRNRPKPIVPSKDDRKKCPSCGAMLLIKDGELAFANQSKSLSTTDIQKACESLENYNAELGQIESDYRQADGEREKALKYAEECEKAKLELTRIEADKNKGKPEHTADEIKVEIEKLKIRIKAIETYWEALDIHNRIQKAEIIIAALADDGVRKTALERALDGFNKELAGVSSRANWEPVRIDADMMIYFGDEPYGFCSRSEKYRIRAILQICTALHDKSDIVIFDDADMLIDKQSRNEFFSLLYYSGIPALVCMAINSPENLPDISKIGGASYWIEEGVVECLELQEA